MSKKEQVLGLFRAGFDACKIAELSGVPIRSVYRYIKNNCIEQELTVINYIKAVNNGYDTKDDLLKQFKVSKKTLLQFEKASGVLALLAKINYIQGKSYEEIGAKLHLRLGTIDGFDVLQLPTIEHIKNELDKVLKVYEEMAEFDSSFVSKSNTIKSALQKLQNAY